MQGEGGPARPGQAQPPARRRQHGVSAAQTRGAYCAGGRKQRCTPLGAHLSLPTCSGNDAEVQLFARNDGMSTRITQTARARKAADHAVINRQTLLPTCRMHSVQQVAGGQRHA